MDLQMSEGEKKEAYRMLKEEYLRISSELDRINKITCQQEDEIIYLREKVNKQTDQCNSQAYEIHNFEQRILKERAGQEKYYHANITIDQTNLEDNNDKKHSKKFRNEILENKNFFTMLLINKRVGTDLKDGVFEKHELKKRADSLKKQHLRLIHEKTMLNFGVKQIQNQIIEKNKNVAPFELVKE